MPVVPWRIAAQPVTILDPETKEPVMTLDFSVDHNVADIMRLRITPVDAGQDALEMQFNTGGYQIGSAVRQPRWLKAFERPDPNLSLNDDVTWEERQKGLSEDQRDAENRKREAMLARRQEWSEHHDMPERHSPDDARHPDGPDSTDTNSVEAQQTRSVQAGVDSGGEASDADRKGMVGQSPGGMTGETLGGPPGMNQPPATNAVDQARQRQGAVVDSKSLKAQPA